MTDEDPQDGDFYKLFSCRVSRILKQMWISNFDQLAKITEKQLLRSPNFGRKSINEIRRMKDIFLKSKKSMTKTTVDSAMLKDVLLFTIRGKKKAPYGSGDTYCIQCGANWKSHHVLCPVAYAQQLLKEIGDE